MTLGAIVLLRVSKHQARSAVIVHMYEDDLMPDVVDLYIFPHQTAEGHVLTHVGRGYDVGQWQSPDVLPQNEFGAPDYAQVDV